MQAAVPPLPVPLLHRRVGEPQPTGGTVTAVEALEILVLMLLPLRDDEESAPSLLSRVVIDGLKNTNCAILRIWHHIS